MKFNVFICKNKYFIVNLEEKDTQITLLKSTLEDMVTSRIEALESTFYTQLMNTKSDFLSVIIK